MPRSLSASISELVSPRWLPKALRLSVGLAMVALSSNFVHADIDPLTSIDFVRIGEVGNAPWPGIRRPVDDAIGRGGVNYEYNVGRLEVTSAQWVEFLNAALDRPAGDQIPFVSVPGSGFWGGSPTTPTNAGGQRFVVRQGQGLLPAGDITWRMAAVLCNWYSNDKRIDRAAFMNGAYDVSTFGYQPNSSIFTDQLAHNPGAKYWIPTWDEWLKAAHYDPNKNGQGQGGWWVYSNRSDTQPIGGPPGTGAGNFGFENGTAFTIPLGSYPQTTSPWGLLDIVGGTSEWTESAMTDNVGVRYRIYDGSWWFSTQFTGVADAIYGLSAEFPHITDYRNGFRIASSVPSPSTGILAVGVCLLSGCRHRRCRK